MPAQLASSLSGSNTLSGTARVVLEGQLGYIGLMTLALKRIFFGGFSVVSFILAAADYRASGISSRMAFAGVAGLVLALASISAKGG